MSSAIWISIQITLAGMGLVFGAILLLWGLMSVLVRFTEPRPAGTSPQQVEAERERKRRAAIAAVTIALARELDTEPHEFPLPPTAMVSAWQSVMRTKMLNKRGSTR